MVLQDLMVAVAVIPTDIIPVPAPTQELTGTQQRTVCTIKRKSLMVILITILVHRKLILLRNHNLRIVLDLNPSPVAMDTIPVPHQ